MISILIIFTMYARLGRFVRAMARRPGTHAIMLSLALTLFGSTVYYHLVEGWSWIDSIYFCVVTLSTVGYGDIVPTTVPGKLFTIVYIIFSIGLVAAFVHELAQTILEEQALKLAKNHPPLPEDGSTGESSNGSTES